MAGQEILILSEFSCTNTAGEKRGHISLPQPKHGLICPSLENKFASSLTHIAKNAFVKNESIYSCIFRAVIGTCK